MGYRFYPKNPDIFTRNRIYSKIWTNLFYNVLSVLHPADLFKIAGWVANSVYPDLLCPNTYLP